MKKKIVVLLPMKANSTRVKGKNFRDFCGKPLFRWILDSLLAVEDIDQIVINTDARDILAENGLVGTDRILIRDRKKEICGDEVSMNRVLADDVENVEADIYLMTHTTNPLLSSNTIKQAINQYNEELASASADSLFTVNKIQTRFYTAKCEPINHDPDNLIPTQDLEPWFEENSNLYLFNRESFAKTNARIGAKPSMMVSPAMECSDIDTPDDWDQAVVMTHYMLEKGFVKL
ncbi:acylneuraminate cytidylyltransferase family protein [Shewanella frigidimarina]|uniref:Acylneuraminate cytidylyltransferase n=1 Tax=Shewanella frigidimarina (strain NCIMB 400) TaxID=318167 RepID=Q07Z87_SHEFN|nr:acylneuraminate cytidylyltransferase family protein [Shewanella frigidimarina]ABI72677.1 acylneuraminate cytidylyltransferase [Shewanella frigidimarina NCIMB 400]